jgi:hypothetical protein
MIRMIGAQAFAMSRVSLPRFLCVSLLKGLSKTTVGHLREISPRKILEDPRGSFKRLQKDTKNT